MAVPHVLHLVFGDLAHRQAGVEPDGAAEGVQHLRPPLLGFAALVNERADGTIAERQGGVSDDEVGIELRAGTQAGALRTRPVGRVEREHPGFKLGQSEAGNRAGVVLAEDFLAGFGGVGLLDGQDGQPLAELEGGFHALGEAALHAFLQHNAVNDDLDGVLLVAGHRDVVADFVNLAVHPHTHKTLRGDLLDLLLVFALAAAHDGGKDLQARALGVGQHAVHDLVRGLATDGQAGGGGVGDAHAGVEHAQVVVNFGDSADRGAGVAAGALLVDGDGGGEAFHVVLVGLVHLPEELACVGAEALHIAALAFGKDGVEREATLAGAAEAGDHHQLVARDGDADVLEIVLPGPVHHDLVCLGGRLDQGFLGAGAFRHDR